MVNLNELNFDDKVTVEVDGINVKQYLPIEQKLVLAGNIINASTDDSNFYNPARLEIFYVLNMVRGYTDIEYNDMEIFEAYDRLVGSGSWAKIESAIPADEKDFIMRNVTKVIDNIYAFKNSAVGIVNAITEEAKKLEIDGEKIQNIVADPEVLSFTKNILTKLA